MLSPLRVLVALLGVAPSWAQDLPNGSEDLTDLSLEELMNIDIEVTSVSRRSESLSNTSAAVYVISSEDIRRSGAHSIPEALRLAPGLHVARLSTGDYAISARGFSGEFANKMLVLIDGRSIYTPLFSALLRSILEPTRPLDAGHRAHRSDSRPGRNALGRERSQRRDQHHHQTRG